MAATQSLTHAEFAHLIAGSKQLAAAKSSSADRNVRAKAADRLADIARSTHSAAEIHDSVLEQDAVLRIDDFSLWYGEKQALHAISMPIARGKVTALIGPSGCGKSTLLAGSTLAWGGCASYVTVQWGDTLSGIAAQCGTTVYAIQAANPGLGYWVYAGQVLYIPSRSSNNPGGYPPPATGGTYVVQVGDTLAKIASRAGTTVSAILAVNPQIYNPNVIYVGQVINMPAGTSAPPPPVNPPANKPCNCPKPAPGHALNTAKVNFKGGMYIRSDPNGAIIASAMNGDTVYYYRNSFFTDGGGCVWVKVKVFPPTNGYYDGWLLVRDQLGQYFTSPQLGG